MTDTLGLLHALAFASNKHRNQRRKDAEASPYINHPIGVATILADAGRVESQAILIAAILHDTVEDTETTFEELEQHFTREVCALVREVTDDKSLPKLVRKRLQIEHARASSQAAKQIKIADKISNIRDIATSPPAGWSSERKREYLDWAEDVVAGCRGVNAGLDAAFERELAAARRVHGLAR